MKGWSKLGAVMLVISLIGTANAQTRAASPANAQTGEASPEVAKSNDERAKTGATDLNAATGEYKSSSEELIRLQEEEIRKVTEELEQLRKLVADGLVARNELDASEHALEELQAKLRTTRQGIADSERLAAEIQ